MIRYTPNSGTVANEGRFPWKRLVVDLIVTVTIGVLLAVFLFLDYLLIKRYTNYTFSSLELELAEAAVILLVGLLFTRALNRAIRGYSVGRFATKQASGVRLIVVLAMGLIVLAAVLSLFGVSVSSIFLGSTFIGVIVGLAGQTVFSNVLAGLTLFFTRPFRTGDRIGLINSSFGVVAPSYAHELQFPAYIGTVHDIGLVYTVLELDGGRVTEVANSFLLNSVIINFSRSSTLQHRIRMTFSLSVPLQMIQSVIGDQKFCAPPNEFPVFAPRVEVSDIGKETWDATVVLTCNEPDDSRIRDRVLRNVLDRLPPAREKKAI